MPTLGPPTLHPPETIPPKPTNSYIIDCSHKVTYPTRIEEGNVSGYIWTGRFWTFYGFDSRFIDEVACYPTPTLY
jgi:hypothetical protein